MTQTPTRPAATEQELRAALLRLQVENLGLRAVIHQHRTRKKPK